MNENMILRFALVGSIVSFFILDCSHTIVIDKESPAEFIEKVNNKIQKKKGIIQTKWGEKYKVKEINVSVDSTSWIDPKTESYETTANSELHNIVIKDHAKGAVSGFFVGFAMGFVMGFAGGDDSQGFVRFSAQEKGGMLGVLVGLFGLIGGAVSGYNEAFKFNDLLSKYYILKGAQLINESQKSIQITWRDNTVQLEKTKIKISKYDDGIDVWIPAEMYKEKFGK